MIQKVIAPVNSRLYYIGSLNITHATLLPNVDISTFKSIGECIEALHRKSYFHEFFCRSKISLKIKYANKKHR